MPKKLIITTIILFTLIGTSFYKLQEGKQEGVAASGTIEVTRADITPKTSGYLTDFAIEPGDKVTAGQTITTIDRADLAAVVAGNEAALEKSLAQLKDLEQGARAQELNEAAAALSAARSLYQKAKDDLVRYETLYQENAVSRQNLDAARSASEVAYQSWQAAEARLSLLKEGARPEVIAGARLEVERNNAVLQASRVLLNDTLVAAPLTGIILSKNYENGEYVNAGSPIATVADLNDCWVRVYIPSNQLGLIGAGQKAEVTVDSFPEQKFSAQVKEISDVSEFTPRQSLSQNERANMVFRVKVKVENESGFLKPGMPADVVIK
ncbi:MAG: efflux RND transporter periplasmic adaptor subunit [Sporomusaceae bacterium]|jgi:HlyD family secretion protein|nr:efflux RND transporter periplasmic adaptor subunit [Sporomusaceae bacterium]